MTLSAESKKWLSHQFGRAVNFDEPMSRHTSFRIGGPADVLVIPESKDELIDLISWCKEERIPYLPVGNGTNLLVKDGGIRGIVILVEKCLNGIEQAGTEENKVFVTAMAGVKMQRLCRYAVNRGLGGLSFALGIPGTVGGGIMMNAGTADGCMENVIDRVTVLSPTGKIEKVTKERLDFSYRGLSIKVAMDSERLWRSVILEGHFALHLRDPAALKLEADKIMEYRKATQPIAFPSPGCFFKNPESGPSAGQLIDQAGLKGVNVGDAEISTMHANYIINRGSATASNVIELMRHVQEAVFKMFTVYLEPEVQIVGE